MAIRRVQYRSFGNYRTRGSGIPANSRLRPPSSWGPGSVQGGSWMNWYDEAKRHQSDLRREAAAEHARAQRRTLLARALDWATALAGRSSIRGDEAAEHRPAIDPVAYAVTPVGGFLADHDAAEPVVELSRAHVAHHDPEAQAGIPQPDEMACGGGHESCSGPASPHRRRHMKGLQPRLRLLPGVDQGKADHRPRAVLGN